MTGRSQRENGHVRRKVQGLGAMSRKSGGRTRPEVHRMHPGRPRCLPRSAQQHRVLQTRCWASLLPPADRPAGGWVPSTATSSLCRGASVSGARTSLVPVGGAAVGGTPGFRCSNSAIPVQQFAFSSGLGGGTGS